MVRLVASVLFALILSAGAFASQAAASEGSMHMASLASVAKAGHMGDWISDWLAQLLQQGKGGTNGGSVPVPGTLLAFGLGFAGLAAWRAVQARK